MPLLRMNAATAASYSPGDIVGMGSIGFSRLRIIAKPPDRIISAYLSRPFARRNYGDS
jgi:hypothetical protein